MNCSVGEASEDDATSRPGVEQGVKDTTGSPEQKLLVLLMTRVCMKQLPEWGPKLWRTQWPLKYHRGALMT